MHTSVRDSGKWLAPGELIAENILELLDEPDDSDRQWRSPLFSQLPKRFAKATALEYKETYIFEGRFNANRALLEQYGEITKNSIPLDATDNDLLELAKRIVIEMKSISRIYLSLEHAVSSLLQRAQKYEVNMPTLDDPNITSVGLYTRLTDEYWWLRALRKIHAKKLEFQAIKLGFVHNRAGTYVSDETLTRRKEQKKRNRHTLDGLLIINVSNSVQNLPGSSVNTFQYKFLSCCSKSNNHFRLETIFSESGKYWMLIDNE